MTNERHRGSPVAPTHTMRQLVGERVWSELIHHSHERPHRRGDVLLQQGADGTHVLALLAGLTKVEIRERNGSVKLLAFRGPGELLGEMAAIGGGGRLASVTSLSPCQVAVMKEADFAEFASKNNLHPIVMRFTAERFRESIPNGEALRYRLVTALVRVADILIESGIGTQGRIVLPLRMQDLACHLGVHRNTVSDRLKELEDTGVEVIRRTGIVIDDLPALRCALDTLRE
ncbi:Crp/Fnr family transcriptional regulator [Streptomyces cinnamoneus]|uniref:Crp/Fnr family transcriptional regulator n=1 Tax=Streptomyces cinnamoneus TaxID=53446 RepID=UPI003433CA1C